MDNHDGLLKIPSIMAYCNPYVTGWYFIPGSAKFHQGLKKKHCSPAALQLRLQLRHLGQQRVPHSKLLERFYGPLGNSIATLKWFVKEKHYAWTTKCRFHGFACEFEDDLGVCGGVWRGFSTSRLKGRLEKKG